jgi:transposase
MLKRWDRFSRFIDDGRICLTNNAAERAVAMATLIMTAKLNDIDPQAWDPQAWLANVLARINDHSNADLAALLPWHWAAAREHCTLAA